MAPTAEARERYEELLRLIAHDLRNPLTSVQLNGQLLERAASGSGQEKQRRWARLVVEAARRMDDMVGKLVEAERLRSGKIGLARETVVLGQVLRDVVASMALEGNRVRLTVPPEPLTFAGDRGRIGQALALLLHLAVQEGNSAAEIRVEPWARDGNVGCSIGVPRAVPLPDGPPGGTCPRSPFGHGIPMHFARTVIECHGGTLRVELGDQSTLGYEIALPSRPAAG